MRQQHLAPPDVLAVAGLARLLQRGPGLGEGAADTSLVEGKEAIDVVGPRLGARHLPRVERPPGRRPPTCRTGPGRTGGCTPPPAPRLGPASRARRGRA